MKRFLLITDIFPPDIGGPATFIPALAAALQAEGHEVTVVCRAEAPSAHSANEWPFCVRRFPRRGGRLTKLRMLSALLPEVRRYDVIFSNGLESFTERACRLARRNYALKIVGDLAWERARGEGRTQRSLDEFQTAAAAEPARSWIEQRRRFTMRARLVITPSEYLRRIVLGWGVAPERTRVVPNGARLEEFDRFVPRRRSGEMFELLFVGRLVNWKGLGHLLEAIAPLAGVRLTIVGDGLEGPRLRVLAQKLGIGPRAAFLGAQPRAEVLRQLERADALALPSEYEGLSHTLLEACAAAVPCITTDRGGNPEVIEHERCGLLVPYGDVVKLRSAIQRLQADEGLRFTLAQGAKVRSRAFDFHATVVETMKLLLQEA